MLRRFTLFFLLFLGIAFKSYSQKFEWVKTYGGTGSESYPICVHSYESSYFAWYSFVNTKFGSFTANNNNKNYSMMLCAGKVDKDGTPLWMWSTDSIIGEASIKNISYDSVNEKVYLSGNLKGSLFSNNVVYRSFYNYSLKSYSMNGFIIKLNKLGVVEKVLIITDSNSNNINSMKYLKDKIVLSLTIGISTNGKFCGIGLPCVNKSGIILCNLDGNLNILTKSSLIECSRPVNEFLLFDYNKMILYTYADKISITDSINYTSTFDGYYALEINPYFNVIRVEKLYSGGIYSASEASITENNEIIVSTSFKDSIIVKNKTIKTDKYLRPIILIYDKNYNLKHYSFPKVILDNYNFASAQYNTLHYYDGYIYAAGNIRGDFKFGDILTQDFEGKVFIAKLDLRGNCLWVKRFLTSITLQYIYNIDAYNMEILFCGMFADTAILNSQQFISNGSLDLIAAKIHDIEITRGFVKSGPYCAGDTIEIPYTKNGTFNQGNQFIAQLSDEDGNFDGNERELGRITSISDSLIQGVLPLFNVASSPNYRIRILSTNPVVQSYYKYDTLRLLIYSKDEAYTGKDTSICAGQSVKLSTSGGSRWRWSPGDLVKDSLAKTTLTIPIKTATFRIIISDSSGCGKIDTAYKTITVRPPLKIIGLPKDTLVCKDSRVSLTLIPSGGLGVNYRYQWLSAFDQPLGNTDTFSININKEGSIKAVLSDGCTQQNDTIQINFTIPQAITAKIQKPDCFDSSLTLKMYADGGYKNNLNHVWYKDNKAIDIGKTINLSGVVKKQWIRAITSDFCNTWEKDSVLLFPNPKAALFASVDSVCQSEPFILYNQSNTHAPINTRLSWLNHQKPWKKQDTLLVFEDIGTHGISINITDSLGCTSNNSIDVNIIEKPVADYIVLPQNPTADHTFLELIPTQSGNKKYTWTIGGLILSQNSWQSLRLPIKDTVSYLATLKVANAFGCVDSVIKTIRIGESDAFYIPNAVSRNGDGRNDDFAPYGWKIQSYDMLIVARTNQVVYKGSTAWKPTFEEGVYSYVLNVKFKDGTENTYKGHVHVIR